jgi:CRISPR/Cas system CMR-associated protein Cmr5 small subunit
MLERDDLDRIARGMLIVLARNGETPTRELREALDVEKNQKINYRGKEVLGEAGAGLVANDGDEQRGSAELTWWLTDAGVEWVEEHAAELNRPASIREIGERLVEIEQAVSDLEDEFKKLEGKYGSLVSVLEEIEAGAGSDAVDEEFETRVSHLENRLEEVDRVQTSKLVDQERLLQRHASRLSLIEDVLLEHRSLREFREQVSEK